MPIIQGILGQKKLGKGPKVGGVNVGGGFARHATPDDEARQRSGVIGGIVGGAEPNSFNFNDPGGLNKTNPLFNTRGVGSNSALRRNPGGNSITEYNLNRSRGSFLSRYQPGGIGNPFKTGLGV